MSLNELLQSTLESTLTEAYIIYQRYLNVLQSHSTGMDHIVLNNGLFVG